MDTLKSFSRRSLFWLLVLNLVLLAILDAAVYLQFFAGPGVFPESFFSVFVPATLILFIVMAVVQWVVIRGSLRRLMRSSRVIPETAQKEAKTRKKSPDAPSTGPSEKEIQKQNQRYYLHLLSVFQRQGRLMDFLKEDLHSYSDAQIGAAVRSIHENCSNIVEKYLSPREIIDENEGREVRIDSDFDSSSIKLTGNVTGEPPFTGVLKHPGWRAGKLELPVLSEAGDPYIIAPAEVEIS